LPRKISPHGTQDGLSVTPYPAQGKPGKSGLRGSGGEKGAGAADRRIGILYICGGVPDDAVRVNLGKTCEHLADFGIAADIAAALIGGALDKAELAKGRCWVEVVSWLVAFIVGPRLW
jgi:hypothetical protein